MRYLYCVLIALGFLGYPAAAMADTPTPLPTIPPSPTSAAQFLYATPTAIPEVTPNPLLNFDTTSSGRGTAYTAINAYRVFNKDHVVDFIIYGIVGIYAIGLVARTIMNWSNKEK